MKTNATKIFVFISAAVITLFDLFMVFLKKETISSYLYTTSLDFPVIPLVIGILVGHVFWPVKINRVNKNDVVENR